MTIGDDQPFEEADMFAHFGITMLWVQTFEYTVKGLAINCEPELPEDTSFEKAWRETAKLLRKPVGPLVEHLRRKAGYRKRSGET